MQVKEEKRRTVLKYTLWFFGFLIIGIFLNYDIKDNIKKVKPSSIVPSAIEIPNIVKTVNLNNHQKAGLFLLIPIGAMIIIGLVVLFDFLKKVRAYQKMSKIKFK